MGNFAKRITQGRLHRRNVMTNTAQHGLARTCSSLMTSDERAQCVSDRNPHDVQKSKAASLMVRTSLRLSGVSLPRGGA